MLHQPRKRFGQHFLRDSQIIEKIVQAIQPKAGDNLIEIGPGEGALTLPLLCRHSPLTAIEIDRDLIPLLQQRAAGMGELQIYQEDVLRFDFSAFAQGRLLRLVGNLPYNISTPLLFHLLQHKAVIQDMYFMLQYEVAERLTAAVNTPAYGRLGILLQYDFTIDYLFTVPPQAFYPPPQVTSAVVRLQPRTSPSISPSTYRTFVALVQQAFQQRRKMLRNSLAAYGGEQILQSLGLDPCARAAELSIADYLRLAQQTET